MSLPLQSKNTCQLILALDIEEKAEALSMIIKAGDGLAWVKIGLQMFIAHGPDFVRAVADTGKRIFLDLKLHDIPNTVAKAVESVANLPVSMLTLHACGGREMMRWAVNAQKSANPDLQLLGVTVLTSMDQNSLDLLGIAQSPAARVRHLADLAAESGMTGLVCSSHEVADLRHRLGPDHVLVTPGIRPAGSDAGDQKRIMTPAQAAAQGSSFIVVGRPIYAAADPSAAVAAIQTELGQ